MLNTLQKRIEIVEGDEISVYELGSGPHTLYSRCYQNRETRSLDEVFSLTGIPVVRGSRQDFDLNTSTQGCSLGEFEVEVVLRYFVTLAKQAGNFVGLEEDELRANISSGKIKIFSEADINRALVYRDAVIGNDTYLKRLEVLKRNVLFPVNLRINIF